MKLKMKRMISILLALAILLQPLALLAKAQQSVRQSLQIPNNLAPAMTVGNYNLFLPFIAILPGAPDFEIINPNAGWTVSGMMYFAVQARDPQTVTSVTFSAGSTTLGTDNTSADGFKVFFDASAFPAGSLALTAVASGPNGETSKTITVNVLPNPPSSGTIGSQGGVLASEIGSIITVPPNALPDGTQLTVDELSQQEVTIQNGIDWDAMGVTFLGAQDIQSTAPFSLPYQVASADFGNRVQPGQAVVNYQIVPDADGDGIDEIVVVNTASVAPNNDVISDPIPQVLLDDMVVIANKGNRVVSSIAGGSSGTPGATIEIQATGLNPTSLQGNVGVWTSLENGETIEFAGFVLPDPIHSSQQIFSTIIPPLPVGQAMLVIRNETTGSTTPPINVTIETTLPLSQPATDTFAEFLADTTDYIANLPAATSEEEAAIAQSVTYFTQAQMDFAQFVSDGVPPELEQAFNDLALVIENASIYQVESSYTRNPNNPSGYDTDAIVGDVLALAGGVLAIAGVIVAFPAKASLAAIVVLLAGVALAGATIVFFYCRLIRGGNCFGDPPIKVEPLEPCPPSATGGGGTTGMGSAPPPGGNGCGNVVGADGGNGRSPRGTGDIVIKIFSGGSPTPFSGVADAGGYFFIPFIPAGSPFTAVAYDLATNETRFVEGVGPDTGEFTLLFFDFFSEQEQPDTIYWDGGGDGTSWHDPLNWDLNHIPGPTEKVVIDVPGDVTVIYNTPGGADTVVSLRCAEAFVIGPSGLLNISIGQASVFSDTLTLNGGELSVEGDLVVEGLLTWNHGWMSGSGVTTANGGILFGENDAHYLDGRTLANNGTAVLQSGEIRMLNFGSAFTNLPGATFELTDGTFIRGASPFNNFGTFIKSGNGDSYAHIYLNNDGLVEVPSGLLTLVGGGTYNGAFQGAGTLELLSGTHELNGSISGLNMLLSSGQIVINGSYDVPHTALPTGLINVSAGVVAQTGTLSMTSPGGAIYGEGDLVVSGLLTWGGGQMHGAGTVTANGGILFSGNNDRYMMNGRNLVNNGTAVFEDGTLTASWGATITNQSGATLDFQGDVSLLKGGGEASFTNLGTVTKSAGNGITSINMPFTNSGGVDVQSGELQFGETFTQTASGTLYVQIGGLAPITEFDQFNITGAAALDGTLDVTLTGGFVPTPGDSFDVITFASRMGQFATVNGHGQGYNVNYNATDVTLVAQ